MMDLQEILALVAGGESMTVELKGDQRRQLNDREIAEAVVCLANSDGGVLLIGVEDDRRITGARPRHGQSTDPIKLQAMVFNTTEPHVNTRVSVVATEQGPVVAIEVDPYPEVCATSKGICVRRVMTVSGPECVPFLPREHLSRRISLGLVDLSAQTCQGTSLADLNPLEFERARQTVTRLRGDQALLELSNEDFAKALQLVETTPTGLVPTIAGVLLLGRPEVILRTLPTHEVAFQVLDQSADIRVNDFFKGPLLQVIEEVQARFDARIEEEEVLVGLYRLGVPEYGRTAFREALLNAVFHRDYAAMGTVFVQWHPDHLLITNPGGFPAGITLSNFLVHEPKPRSPRLYDAAKRLGLVEKSGRGIDRIFFDQLRLGRPAPGYERSDSEAVRVVLRGGKANLAFARLVVEEDKAGRPLSLDELLILNHLEVERRTDTPTVATLIQKPQPEARGLLERLVERGLVEAKGEKKGRIYLLSPAIYRALGDALGYARVRGFDTVQQRQMILDALRAAPGGRITRAMVSDLCKVSDARAYYLLRKMCEEGLLEAHGKGRGAFYSPKRT